MYISPGDLPAMLHGSTANELTTRKKILDRYELDYRDYVAKLMAHYPWHARAMLALSKYNGG